MKYIKWFLYAIIDLVFNAICYVTNPIVLLFADELGNLPAIFKWWSNWDDHLDISWMVTEHHTGRFFWVEIPKRTRNRKMYACLLHQSF